MLIPSPLLALQDYDLPEDVSRHLVQCYGTRALQVAEVVRSGYLDIKPKTMKRISMKYPYLEAEVVFATQQVGGRLKALKPMKSISYAPLNVGSFV